MVAKCYTSSGPGTVVLFIESQPFQSIPGLMTVDRGDRNVPGIFCAIMTLVWSPTVAKLHLWCVTLTLDSMTLTMRPHACGTGTKVKDTLTRDEPATLTFRMGFF